MSNYEEKAKEFREKEGKLFDVTNVLSTTLSESVELLVMASLYYGISNTTIVNLRKYTEVVYQLKISFVDGVFHIKIPAELMRFGRKSIETDFKRNDENVEIILDELSRIEAFLKEKALKVEVKQPNLKDQAITKMEYTFKNLKEAFVDYSKI